MRSKYPQDFIEDIRDMLDEGLSVFNVAWYLGAPEWLVKYVQNSKPTLKASRAWKIKNKERSNASMRAYYKKRGGFTKKGKYVPVDNPFAS